jgi:hypothetical protein
MIFRFVVYLFVFFRNILLCGNENDMNHCLRILSVSQNHIVEDKEKFQFS